MFFGRKMSMSEKEKELEMVRSERMRAEKSRSLDDQISRERARLKVAKENRKFKAFKDWSKRQAKSAKKRAAKIKAKKDWGQKVGGVLSGEPSNSIFSGDTGKRKGKERNIWTDW